MLYHQTTTNQKKKRIKNYTVFKYQLMRPSKSIINLANLRTMLGYSFEEIGFIANVKSFPAQEKGGVQESS